MPYTTVGEVELYYEVHGKGRPLLLLAGLASDSQSWLPVLSGLARHYQVIVFDSRGVGRTRAQDRSAGIPELAGDGIALLRHLGISSASVLGHSMGGFVALECAIRHPQYVSNLILAGTSTFNAERNNALFADWANYLEAGMTPELWFRNVFFWIFTRAFFDDKQTLQDAVRLAVDYPYPQTKSSFRQQVEAIRAFDRKNEAPTITAQTLILCGEEDLLFPPEVSIATLSTIPGAVVAVIEQAAHSMHLEKPEEFIEVVRNFLG